MWAGGELQRECYAVGRVGEQKELSSVKGKEWGQEGRWYWWRVGLGRRGPMAPELGHAPAAVGPL